MYKLLNYNILISELQILKVVNYRQLKINQKFRSASDKKQKNPFSENYPSEGEIYF